MQSKPIHNLHVPLPDRLHDRLRAEAERTRRPATALAREAIESWLEDRERRALHEAISAYARDLAGSGADLDEELERAGIEHLVGRKRKRS